MKKVKNNQGITLIALVIAIVVLIILATVSINMILNDNGIIGAAELAKDKYQNAASKEQSDLSDLELTLEDYQGIWRYDSEKLEVSKGDLTLKVGQKIEYDEGTGHKTLPNIEKGAGSNFDYSTNTLSTKEYTNENLEWRVLGVNEKGQLELISTEKLSEYIYIHGKIGYSNAITKDGVRGTLDTFCHDLYGQGTGAESARGLNMDDLNKFANFNPETDYEGYGTVYTFQYDSTTSTVKCTDDTTKDISEWRDIGVPTFTTPYWKIDSTSEETKTLKDTYYTYDVTKKITSKIENDTISLCEFLMGGEPSALCTQFFNCFEGYYGFGLVQIDTTGGIYFNHMAIYEAEGNGSNPNGIPCASPIEIALNYKLRPVVTLKSNVEIKDTDNNGILNVK